MLTAKQKTLPPALKKIFGSRKNLPNKILDIFEKIEKLSLNNNTLNLNIAFNYGFKDEEEKEKCEKKVVSIKQETTQNQD